MMPPRYWPLGRQRVLVLALTILAALLTAAVLLGPVVQKQRQYDEAIESLVFQIQRLENTLARREGIEADKARLTEALAAADTTLPPVGASVAGARLQGQLQAIAGRAEGFTINSVQSLEPVPAGSSTRISVRIQARSSLPGLKDFLYRVETGRPVAWADHLQVQPDRRSGDRDRSLDVTMTITALMATEPADTP
jgi:hypothetical protein